MDNIILLKSKDKKKVNDFIERHPVISLFISYNIRKNGISNNKSEDHGNLYGIYRKNILIGLKLVFNMGISIFCGTNQAHEKYILMEEEKFVISRKDLKSVYLKNIKTEHLMIMTGVPDFHFNRNRIYLPDKTEVDEILGLKLDFESEYWNYSPDGGNITNFRDFVTEKISEGNVICFRNNSEILGVGFIESETFKACLIGSIMVRKEVRGLGIGKTITLALCDLITSRKKIPCLTVDENNTRAYTLYKNIGFRTVSFLYLSEINR